HVLRVVVHLVDALLRGGGRAVGALLLADRGLDGLGAALRERGPRGKGRNRAGRNHRHALEWVVHPILHKVFRDWTSTWIRLFVFTAGSGPVAGVSAGTREGPEFYTEAEQLSAPSRQLCCTAI